MKKCADCPYWRWIGHYLGDEGYCPKTGFRWRRTFFNQYPIYDCGIDMKNPPKDVDEPPGTIRLKD